MVKQVIPHTQWPSGDAKQIALVRFQPFELQLQFSISFEWDCDDLEEYQLAAIHGDDIGQIWLWRHKNYPDPGTTIVVDVGIPTDIAIEKVKEIMNLRHEDLVWIREV